MIERATKHTAYPVYWGKNQKGMQAQEELSPKDQERAKGLWLAAAESAARYAQELADIGVHKQITNRLIENFQYIETVVTSSMWANFYALRNHPDAQPEIKALATAMLTAHRASSPRVLEIGDWHLPFVTEDERNTLAPDVACKVSAARCARTSYLTHDKRKPVLDEDFALFEKLMGGEVKHSSPTEHQAQMAFQKENMGGNLGPDWVQFRKTIKGEYIGSYDEFE
jgi:thymidylate synthase ThyX